LEQSYSIDRWLAIGQKEEPWCTVGLTSERPFTVGLTPEPSIARATRYHRRLWYEILPWINEHMTEIIGEGNTGAIDFLPTSENPRPIIRIFASNTDFANSNILQQKLASEKRLQGWFEVELLQGGPQRSVHQDRPGPGAPIGISNIPSLQYSMQTFGGYICLEHDGFTMKYGLACHHMLGDPPVANSGVRDGMLNSKVFLTCQPPIGLADLHNDREKKRGTHSYVIPEEFGEIACSSGYGTKAYESIRQLASKSHQVTICVMLHPFWVIRSCSLLTDLD
jgi:hypothetical protein